MARITVIDDSAEFLQLMRDILTELHHDMTGFKAVAASIEQVVDSAPELLIVDLRLEDRPQEMSGWELMVLARAHRKLLGVPIILCSADVRELTRRSAELEQVANVHVMPKPFHLDEISDLIARLLGTSALRPGSA
jgi:CheY-like chemotaxis protein